MFTSLTKPKTGRLNKSPHTVHAIANRYRTSPRRIDYYRILLIAGLLVEFVTLRRSHPTAFLFFLLLGGALMALGIGVYLLSLVSDEDKPWPE